MSEYLADRRVGVTCTRHPFVFWVHLQPSQTPFGRVVNSPVLERRSARSGGRGAWLVSNASRANCLQIEDNPIEVRTRCHTSSLHRPPCLRAGLRRRWHRRQRQAHAVGTHCAQLAWDRNCTSTVDSSRAASVASEVLAQTSMHLIRYSYNVHGVRIAESTVHYSHSTAAGHLSKLNQNHMNKGEAKSQAFSI